MSAFKTWRGEHSTTTPISEILFLSNSLVKLLLQTFIVWSCSLNCRVCALEVLWEDYDIMNLLKLPSCLWPPNFFLKI